MSQLQSTQAAVSQPAVGYHCARPIFVWQAAKICHISERAIRAAATAGRLRGFKRPDTPKLWRFWRSDVEQYCYEQSRRVRPPLRRKGSRT
jgi:hypothetical protein